MSVAIQYHLKERHATWLELFFDLVIVACIGVVTHNLGHLHHGHIPLKQLWLLPVEFFPVWWIWVTHTLYANFFDTDGKAHRISTLLIMFLVVSMSTFLGKDLMGSYRGFISFFIAIQTVAVAMFFTAGGRFQGLEKYARAMGLAIVADILICVAALLVPPASQQAVFVGGLFVEMLAFVWIASRYLTLPVHRSHLVERMGLLSIILLGETVISLVAGLRGIEWNGIAVMRALSGFLLIGAIWWIYFDSFPVLERAERIKNGFVVLLPNALFCMGLMMLATMTRYVILDELHHTDFRRLAVGGMTLFYFGKQIIYYTAFPVYRKNIIINSVVCIGVTFASSFLPKLEYAMIGITLGMFFYVYSTFRWILTKDVGPYLVKEE